MIALRYNDVNVNFTLGDFTDCVESYDAHSYDAHLVGLDTTNYILECVPQSVGIFMDSEPRRALAQMEQAIHTIHYQVGTIIVNNDETCFKMGEDGICSCEYIHITNEDGSEIDRQVLDSIDIELNRQSRFNLSGFQSRHFMPEFLPHSVRDNSTSQNLYYIAFNPPPQFSTLPLEPLPTLNVFEVNLGRTDTNHMTLTYNPHVALPPRIKITIMRRLHNVFNIGSGGSGYASAYRERLDIRTADRRHSTQPIVVGAPSTSFLACDTVISLPSDENVCVITLEPLHDNTDVVQCPQCHKVCLLEAMKEWFKRQKCCPHCRAPSDRVQFITGKCRALGIVL